MKILLIGASGMIGSRILTEATQREHAVIAVARNPEKIAATAGVSIVGMDIADETGLAELAADSDVIISALSPRNTGNAVEEAAAFTRSLVRVHEQTGKRILMVGGGSSLQMPDGTSALTLTPEAILPEATAMREAYALLVAADIDFVVLAPGGMIEPGERTERFRLGDRTMLVDEQGNKSRISAEDYAIAMLDEVERPRHFRTLFNVAY